MGEPGPLWFVRHCRWGGCPCRPCMHAFWQQSWPKNATVSALTSELCARLAANVCAGPGIGQPGPSVPAGAVGAAASSNVGPNYAQGMSAQQPQPHQSLMGQAPQPHGQMPVGPQLSQGGMPGAQQGFRPPGPPGMAGEGRPAASVQAAPRTGTMRDRVLILDLQSTKSVGYVVQYSMRACERVLRPTTAWTAHAVQAVCGWVWDEEAAALRVLVSACLVLRHCFQQSALHTHHSTPALALP